jgi:hypothetical protein
MTRRITLALFAVYLLAGCNRSDTIRGGMDAADRLRIHRFDKELFRILSVDAPELNEPFTTEYASMLKALGLGVFKQQDTQTSAFRDRLINYYSEPTLYKLYEDALAAYDDVETIEAQLAQAFDYLHVAFPEMQIPAVYMHVSGFGQNLLVDDSLLSLSIDKYLGSDYPLYQDFFYAYQRQRMTPEHVAADYVTAWLLSEYPFGGNDRVLLERMVYEGKIKYLVGRALPEVAPATLMGYMPAEYKWCRENERTLWRLIIERKQLYTPDFTTTSKYFTNAPAQFISDDAPGNIGAWIGGQIVSRYVERTKSSPSELMMNADAQDILMRSRYKP